MRDESGYHHHTTSTDREGVTQTGSFFGWDHQKFKIMRELNMIFCGYEYVKVC
jgi:hypothetical protein